MTWNTVLNTVKDIAPSLAAAAGTAVGSPLLGGVLGALARKLTGADPGADPDQVAADLLGDPDKLQAFRMEARKLELEELRLRTLDVQDARKTLPISRGAATISTVVVIGYMVAMGLVMTVSIPDGSQSLAYLLLGNLGTGFGMVLTFWLGSSVGSKNKDATMSAYLQAAQADQSARLGGAASLPAVK